MALAFTPLTGASLAASGSPLTTPASTTPASGFIALVAVLASVPVTSVTDNKGNTYTKIAESAAVPGDSQKCALWACVGAVGGSGHTFTINSGDYSSLFPAYVTGYDTTNPWDTNPLVSGTGTGNSLALNQPTLAQANELLLFPILVNGSTDNPGETPPAGFSTWFLQQNWSTWTGFASYLITSAATAATRTATGTNWNSSTGFIVGIREASAAGADLAAAPAAVATLVGSLTTQKPLNATTADVATVTAALTTQKRLNAAPAARSTITAVLTTQKRLNAAMSAVSTVSGTLAGGAAALTATAQAVSTLTGGLSTAIRPAATLQASASLAGTLTDNTAGAALAASLVGQATATAALTTQKRLAAWIGASATITASLTGGSAALSETGTGGIDPAPITQGFPRGGKRKALSDLFEREDEQESTAETAGEQSPIATKSDTTSALDSLAISTLENLQLLQLEAVQAAQLAAQIDREQQAALAQAMLQRRQDEELALLLLLS